MEPNSQLDRDKVKSSRPKPPIDEKLLTTTERLSALMKAGYPIEIDESETNPSGIGFVGARRFTSEDEEEA